MNKRWKRVPIKELYHGLYDGPHATPKPSESGPVFLGIRNITEDGHFDLNDVRHIAEEDFAKWTRRVEPRPNDIVFTYEATLNRYALIPPGFRGCLGRRLALIRPNTERVEPKFLFRYFFSDDWRKTIATKTVIGSTVDRIPLLEFPDFLVSLPSLPAQRKIASILSAYDDLIENNTRRIAILEAMAQAIYREWFVEFRFPGHEKIKLLDSPLGKIPEDWQRKPLREVAQLRLGKMLDAKKNKGDLMPYLANINVRWGQCDLQNLREMRFEADEREAYGLKYGDIVMCEGGEPGRCAIWTEQVPNMMLQKAIHRIRSGQEVGFRYLYHNLRHKGQGGHLESLFTGATIKHLPREKLDIVPVEVPPKSLTDFFSQMVEPMAHQVEVLNKRNANLRKTRDFLLPKLISGDLEVEDLDIETGEQEEAIV